MFTWLIKFFFNPAWAIENLFTLYGGGKDGADAPDYEPLAKASKEAAEIGSKLGYAQLDQAQQQYENNMAVAKPVVDAQLGLMKQQQQQGDDYYQTQKTFGRPLENSLSYAAMGLTDNEALASQFDAINAQRAAILKDQTAAAEYAKANPVQKAAFSFGQTPGAITYKNQQYTPQELLSLANGGDKNAAKALTGAGYAVQQTQIGETAPTVAPRVATGGMGDYAANSLGVAQQAQPTPIKAYQFTADAEKKLTGNTFTSGNEQLDAYLKSTGTVYQEPKYAVDYSYTTGTGKKTKTVSGSLTPEAALNKLNTVQAQLAAESAKPKQTKTTIANIANLKAELNSLSSTLQNSGYTVAAGQDGKMQFTVDPKSVYGQKVTGYQKQFGDTVEQYRQQLGLVQEESPYASRDFDAEMAALDQKVAALSRQADRDVAAKSEGKRAELKGLNDTYAQRIGESNNAVYLRNKADIDAETDMAVADARNGYTNAINIAAREGLRYGFSPERLAAAATSTGTAQATKQASAANLTRKAATETMYGRGVGAAGQKLTGGVNNRNYEIQDDAIATAKKLDLAGLYRGLTGASQGAYGLSVNAGNSAVNNNAQAGNALAAQTNAGIGTIQNGLSQKIDGLNGIVNSQTSIYNQNANGGDALMGTLGQLGGAAIAKWSDKNIKKDIEPFDDDEDEEALNAIVKTGISHWKYDKDKASEEQKPDLDDKPHVGAMAQDMQKNMGNKVSNGKQVDLISALGITMAGVKALNKKVERLERGK